MNEQLIGGYRVAYNPRDALERLQSDREPAMEELWENLYHQGDVDTASYFAVPDLVKAGELSLVGAIEVARHEQHNPQLPDSLKQAYENSLKEALNSNPSTEADCRGYYAIHASVMGHIDLARALELIEVSEVLHEHGLVRIRT